MTNKGVKALIALNKSNYENWLKSSSQAEIGALAKTWFTLFKNYTDEEVFAAFYRALTYCEFAVKPANIFAELRKAKTINKPSAEEMWRQLNNAADYCFEMSYRFSFTAQSASNPELTQGQQARINCEDKFKALPKQCQRYIGSVGRLIDLGRFDEQEREQYQFPRFRRFVEMDNEREETLDNLAIAGTSQNLLEAWEGICH